MTKPTDNTAALAKVNVVPSLLTWFGTILKHWHRDAGSKPTDAMLMVPVLLGKRPGVEALHLAMTLRPEGCTVTQFCLAGSCGPANNYRRAEVKAGRFALTVEGKPYAYKCFITAKGEQALERAQKALTDAAANATAPKATKKAKGKRKAKAPAAVTVDPTVNETPAAPAGDAQVVEAPATGEQPQA